MQLYPHNQNAYDSAVEIFRKHNKTCIIQPTGTGKAVIIAKFITSNKKAKHLLLAPGEHIAAEVRKHVEGTAFDFRTYMSLLSEKTMRELKELDYIYLDEFHRIGAEAWGPMVMKLLGMNPQAKVLGTTATHIRFLDDGRDMAFELFKNNIASFISLNRAFLEGILYPPKYVSAIYSIAEEHERLAAKIRKSKHKNKKRLFKDLKARVIDWEMSSGIDVILKKHLPSSRRKLIVFCANINEMKTAEETLLPTLKAVFGSVLSLHVHSKLQRSENRKILARFHEDDDITKVLFTVDMMNEGLHAKDISTVILLRETGSPIIWYQQIGRCLSVGQKEQPIILDLVNNFKNIQLNTFKVDYEDEKLSFQISNTQNNPDSVNRKVTAVEFIDETLGIQDILNSFADQVDSWEIWYKKAKGFFERNGHLSVPLKEDVKLLRWVQTQLRRFKAGRLSTQEIALLTKIGMDWEKTNDEKWHANFLELKKVIEKHGYFSRKLCNEYLRDWFSRQKIYYKRNTLKKEYKELLESVVSLEDDRTVLWNSRLKRLEEYCALHKKFPTGKGKGNSIKKDVVQVRASHRMGSLPPFVYNRLKELNFVFVYKRKTFEETLEMLLQFLKDNNGQFPTQSTEPYLTQWLSTQSCEYRHGRLEKEYVDLCRSKGAAAGFDLLAEMKKKSNQRKSINQSSSIPTLIPQRHARRA